MQLLKLLLPFLFVVGNSGPAKLPNPVELEGTKPQTSFQQILDTEPVLGVATVSAAQAASSSASIEQPAETGITIALLGDSMIDTLGPFDELIQEVQKFYPELSITILNYGVGGQNIDAGIQRITHNYTYLGKNIPSLASQKPDIVIIESFGYNPYSYKEGAVNAHWLALAHAVDTVKQSLPNAKIMIAATIGPNVKTFGDGKLNLDFASKFDKVSTIKEYLESTTRFAAGEKLPLIDAYHPSLLPDGNGDPKYINPGDNIHPSDEGRKFFAEKVAQSIVDNGILLTPPSSPLEPVKK